jgi:hypothetical protein
MPHECTHMCMCVWICARCAFYLHRSIYLSIYLHVSIYLSVSIYPHLSIYFRGAPRARGLTSPAKGPQGWVQCEDRLPYGWIGHKPGSGLSDMPRLWTGFELPSSCINLPCYALNRNRNILDFMRWPQIDLGAQDLNDIQRPKSFQTNSWK